MSFGRPARRSCGTLARSAPTAARVAMTAKIEHIRLRMVA
jgi:hypothetical protein